MILNLSHCKLKVIRQDAFRYCPHLAYLDLSNNELQLIEFGALKNLSECNVRANPHLKEIDYMTQISAKLFSYDEKSVRIVEPKVKSVENLLNFFYNQKIKMVLKFYKSHKNDRFCHVDLVFKSVNPIVGKEFFVKIDFNQTITKVSLFEIYLL